MPRGVTQTVLAYVKAIHDEGGARQRVRAGVIAARLGRQVASVNGMVRRLVERGWIDHEPRSGVRFTPDGLAEARRAARRLRLLEGFLTAALGFGPAEARAEADALLHATSARLERALADYLSESAEDPPDKLG